MTNAEERMLNEMVARVERATQELHDALHALADVAVTTPQRGEPLQWRWHLAEAIRKARKVTGDSRFR